jgi:quinolinate synthase
LLETIERPGKNLVTVPEDVQAGALLALERMLALPA